MTDQDQELLLRLRQKIEQLMESHRFVKEEIESMRAHNLQLTNTITQLEEEKTQLNEKIEKMKLANAFGGNGYSKDEAKKRINVLVREIDQCIAMLNK